MATIEQIAKVKRDARNVCSLLTDTEIGDIIDEQEGIHALAVAYCYDLLAADLMSRGELQVGKYSEKYDEQIKQYKQIAGAWRGKVILRKPYAGGISKNDVESKRLDSDRIDGIFRKGMNDAP